MHPQHLPLLNDEVLLPLRIHLQPSWRSTGPCRSWLLWFWTDMYFFGLRHVRWFCAICFLRCCLWCLTWWKKWRVKCVILHITRTRTNKREVAAPSSYISIHSSVHPLFKTKTPGDTNACSRFTIQNKQSKDWGDNQKGTSKGEFPLMEAQ